jgi:fluoride exporter
VTAGWWVAFLAAAVAGAVARYLLDGIVQERTGGRYPWGTCVINISGSFVLGLVTGAVLYHGFSTQGRFVLGTGFCGAYTTFSTFTFETLTLAESGRGRAAARNVVLSVAGGLAAAGAGLALAAL